VSARPWCSPDCQRRAGWIEDADGNITGRCPCRTAADTKTTALAATADANPNALEAAVRVIRDAARVRPVFSANDCRPAMEYAQVPGPVVGAAFARAVKLGYIEFESFLPSTDPGTHGHHIRLYRSKLCGIGAA
jgi:hypothetical protein